MILENLPWRYDEENKAVVDSTNTVVRVSGISQPCGYVPDDDLSYAHGRLLAAGPDLLKACEEAKEFLIGEFNEPGRTVFWNLAAAIAKAERRS